MDQLDQHGRITDVAQGSAAGARPVIRGGSPVPVGRPAQPVVPARPAQPVSPAARHGLAGASLIPIGPGAGVRSCRLPLESSPGPVQGDDPVDDAEHVQVLSAELLAAACVAVPPVMSVPPAVPRPRRDEPPRSSGGWRLTERGMAAVVTSFVAVLVLGLGGVVHSFLSIPDEPVGQDPAVVQVDRGR